jgi:uncharacterized protein (DUF2147 family)
MKKLILALCLATLLLTPVLISAQKALPADAITGIWFNAEKDAKIEVYKAGNSYFGKVIWLKVPNDAKGKPKTDIENPDPKLKTRPRLNLIVLTDLKPKGGGEYEKGKIYDPKNGKTYSCQAELKDKNTLALRGYIGVSVIGRTSQWERTK